MKIFIITFGCKVNQYESQSILEKFYSDGCTKAESVKDADVVVVNSCTVTAESDKKVKKALHKIRKENNSAVIVLTGCMPQAFPAQVESINEVDIILGNNNKNNILKYVLDFINNRSKIIKIENFVEKSNLKSTPINDFDERTRAFLKIEDGCNRFCSYCIIPYARGRVRSKPLEDILFETKNLAQKGYKEIVLVGINLSAYGTDIGINLCDAIEKVCSVEGIKRVRLGSLEPEQMDEITIKRLSKQKKLCPQFHLSLQSGCNETLKRMNRRYTTAAPTNAPANCATIYPGTIDHAKLPSTASAKVSAGLNDAPDAAPNIHAGSITASPHANELWTVPPPFMPDLLRFTFATTPSPKMIRIIVPKNSAIYGNILSPLIQLTLPIHYNLYLPYTKPSF